MADTNLFRINVFVNICVIYWNVLVYDKSVILMHDLNFVMLGVHA